MCRVSSTAKHFIALHTMVERNYSHALILEDDACISLGPDEYPWAPKCNSSVTPADFRDSLPQRLQELPQDFDMLFVGTCSVESYEKPIRPYRSYKNLVESRSSRCVSGMVVTLSGAKKLLATLPMRHPFDIHINVVSKRSSRGGGGMDKLKLFWTMPPMMAQTDQVCGTNVRTV
jgi:GR25 family glycosyltransferase involved in LPS biosynthesis